LPVYVFHSSRKSNCIGIIKNLIIIFQVNISCVAITLTIKIVNFEYALTQIMYMYTRNCSLTEKQTTGT